MLVRLISPVLVATSVAAQVPATSEDLSDQIIMGAWGDPAKCNFTNATPVAFMDAATGNGTASGDCVAVIGYWKGGAMFANAADANITKSTVNSSLKGRRVGIYADEKTMADRPRNPKPFKIIGSYASCATEWPGAMMVMGYCHFSDGPFLKVSQVLPVSKHDVR